MGKHFFYLSEVAALLGISTAWTGTLLKRGDIPAERIGAGRWRVRQRELRSFAERQQITLDWDALEALHQERAEAKRQRQARYAQAEGEQVPPPVA